jgi:hypothetical protein
MLKPETFQHEYIALNNLPYSCGESRLATTSFSGGVLRRGETVWVEHEFGFRRPSKDATAYVDGLGVITVNPERLVRADALKPIAKEPSCQNH